MLKKYYPTWHAKSVFEIDYQKLKSQNISSLIFDIDNTLVHHGDDSNKQIDSFLMELKNQGFQILLLSDNSRERIDRFNINLNFPYIEEAKKPFPDSYLKALSILNSNTNNTVVIGDQIFKDILGANNTGLKSILVDFIKLTAEKKIGITRYIEKLILIFFHHSKNRKLFCQRNPYFYKISVRKETFKRHIQNTFTNIKFAKTKSAEKLPLLVFQYKSILIKTGKGIDPTLQQNKAINIKLASSKINNTIIKPGEVFSFWKSIGKTSASRGYKKGRILVNQKLVPGTGGGLCNLANTINQVVLHSPLKITELHFHSDCLAPEEEHHIFSSGTSVDYNYIDFRFKNTTDQKFQLLTWCDEKYSYAELRCQNEIDFTYELEEENRHYEKINDRYFCFSKIYKITRDKKTSSLISKELVRDNKSEVMYDYSQIPL